MKNTFKKGQLVEFNVINDDSGYASDCFGVEPQNDWFDISVYCEKVYGEIVARNTIESIDKDGDKTGIIFKIVNGVIKSEVDDFLSIKYRHGLTNKRIFEDSGLKSFDDFKRIKLINHIKLESKWQRNDCISSPPKTEDQKGIWRKKDGLGVFNAKYIGGKWIDSKTGAIINDISDDFFWIKVLDRIYMNGKIYIQENNY